MIFIPLIYFNIAELVLLSSLSLSVFFSHKFKENSVIFLGYTSLYTLGMGVTKHPLTPK